jgi:hypothetical protein
MYIKKRIRDIANTPIRLVDVILIVTIVALVSNPPTKYIVISKDNLPSAAEMSKLFAANTCTITKS